MDDVARRIKELQMTGLYHRLIRGARVLGSLYRKGARCASGWTSGCACEPRTPFCDAKLRWVQIVHQWAPEWIQTLAPEHPYYVILAMTVRMLEASEITLDIAAPGLPTLKFGPLGTDWTTWQHLVMMQEEGPEVAREAWLAVAKIQGAFEASPLKEADDGGR